MNHNNYIEVIKNLISSKAKEHASGAKLDAPFFEALLEKIRESVTTVFRLMGYPELDEVTLNDYFAVALKEYLSVNPIVIEPSHALTKKGFQTWLTSEYLGPKFVWNYTNRYLTMLSKTGRNEKVIKEVEASSLSIVEKMGNPRSTSTFYTRGLVVGSVQSGKTGNFNAVINRSIDLGYGLIIILSGIMEDLRTQTQLRIESDVIGEGLNTETKKNQVKGVGNISRFGKLGGSDVEQVISITSSKSDFNNNLVKADFSLNHTNILVCKKNVSVLKNLLIWLHDYMGEDRNRHDIPFLIIDDEADNASLNNEGKKGREYASKINGHIRALLSLFNKKTYLGYTATPFANVLQDRNPVGEAKWIIDSKITNEDGVLEKRILELEDYLFPDDFIVLLNPPSNYIGAKQIFQTAIEDYQRDKIPLVEVVSDHSPSFPSRVMALEDGSLEVVASYENKKAFDDGNGYESFDDYNSYRRNTRAPSSSDNFPQALPPSLKESIVCFILATAIRESRKKNMIQSALYNPHNTMLVHISRYTAWQNRTLELVKKYLVELKSDLSSDFPRGPESIYAELERLWYKYYAAITESIQNYLPINYDDRFMAPVSFEAIKKYIPDVIREIEVRAINSETKDKLEYNSSSPKKIIAIGGNRLSRGFTLEGLTINYFIRATNYSDTLLQMGRWFGYRPGYLDCCKLFITQDSVDKFNSTTRAIEELEIEFKKMELKGKTPANFVLRVKKHPGTLKITRPSILSGTKEVKWSYQDKLEQTTDFMVSPGNTAQMWAFFRDNIVAKFKWLDSGKGFLITETSPKEIIRILEDEGTHFSREDAMSMVKFIQLCDDKKLLQKWTIAIKSKGQANAIVGKGSLKPEETGLDSEIQLSIRRGPKQPNDLTSNIYRDQFLNALKFAATGRSANIIAAADMSILLSKEEKSQAVEKFRQERMEALLKEHKEMTPQQARAEAEEKTIPERVYREKMSSNEGLMIIYLFDSWYTFLQEKGNEDKAFTELVAKHKVDLDMPIIGTAIGFPPIEPDPGGYYLHGDYGFEEEDDGLDYIEETDSAIPND
ncbi:Z1 domain-containing protein [Pedobacter endophyticus]|uniref:Z1 domain-containing protein n=1 Tax=Pedobacter endophyticus TaxID=2789740 RepID=A0A7U3Q3H7_9SPHI|nr:Z1 domain-containing protein [Pedobacter endophyticus]QPH37869.1 Z1 domain-containing protein [Pedobacter endophyticus]